MTLTIRREPDAEARPLWMSGEPPGIKAGGRSMTSRRFCVWRTASLQNGQQQKSSSTDELSMSVWIVGIRMIFGRGSPGEEWLCAQKALWGILSANTGRCSKSAACSMSSARWL